MGYYGGAGARRVATVASDAVTPHAQPDCFEEIETHLVDCGNWHVSAVWHVPGAALSGVYFAKIIRRDGKAFWRSDNSPLAPSPKFADPDIDSNVAPPCRDGTLGCEAKIHAYGAQRRARYGSGMPLSNAIREPTASHAYFVVRAAGPRAAGELVLQTMDTTWQAYNNYLAPSTYGVHPLPHHNMSAAIEKRIKAGAPARAYKASYNRPFITRDVRSVNTVFHAEYPMIRFLEGHGYNVTYVAGIDAHLQRGVGVPPSPDGGGGDRGTEDMGAGGDAPWGEGTGKQKQKHTRTRLFISVGHDEYWSSQQRRNVQMYRDRWRMNLAFFSGNEMYWNIRWEDSPLLQWQIQEQRRLLGVAGPNAPVNLADDGGGNALSANPTVMVVYKESQNSFKIDPRQDMWTGTFRDPRDINPQGPWPENSLTGTIFTVNAWRNDPLHVPHRHAQHRFWRDTSLRDALKPNQTGVLLKGLLGHEWDEDIDNGHRPSGLMRLSATTVDNVQIIVNHGSVFDSGTCTHSLVLYHHRDRAHAHPRAAGGTDPIVFGAGTVQWAWGLDEHHDTPTGHPNQVENAYDTRVNSDLNGAPDQSIVQATINLFADMRLSKPATLLAVSRGVRHAHASTDVTPPVSEYRPGLLDVVALNNADFRASVNWNYKQGAEAAVSSPHMGAVQYSLHFSATDDAGFVGAMEVRTKSVDPQDLPDYTRFFDKAWHPARFHGSGSGSAFQFDLILPCSGCGVGVDDETLEAGHREAADGRRKQGVGHAGLPLRSLIVEFRAIDDSGNVEAAQAVDVALLNARGPHSNEVGNVAEHQEL